MQGRTARITQRQNISESKNEGYKALCKAKGLHTQLKKVREG